MRVFVSARQGAVGVDFADMPRTGRGTDADSSPADRRRNIDSGKTGLKLWHSIPASEKVMENDVVGQSVFSLPDDDPVVCAVDELVGKITSE